MTEVNHVPFRFIGGKAHLADLIISLLPPHKCYVEPFGGGAAVLLRKSPSEVEVYNDIDQSVVNFFLQLRDNTKNLIWKLTWTPYSRFLHDKYLKEWKEKGPPADPLEWAVRWHFITTSSIDGQFTTFAISEQKSKPMERNNVVDNLDKIAKRLRNVTIECLDFVECIKRYDNVETVFYCVLPGTIIRTDNDELIPIESVKNSDKVGGGIIRRFKRSYQGEVLSLKVGLSEPLEVTPEHPILAIPLSDITCPRLRGSNNKRCTYRIIGKPTGYCHFAQRKREPCQGKEYNPRFIQAKDLKPGDLLAVPIYADGYHQSKLFFHKEDLPSARRKCSTLYISPQLAKLLGLYLAEGHSTRTAVGFSFGNQEEDLITETKSLIKELFNIDCAEYKLPQNSTQLIISSISISRWFAELCGVGAHSKYLSKDIMSFPVELKNLLLIYWLKGDGGFYKSSRNRRRITGTTVSSKLAHQLFIIALQCGYKPHLKRRGNNYDLYFTGYDVDKLLGQENKGKDRSEFKIVGNYLLMPLRSITKKSYSGPVYNLQTLSGTYISNFILTHNCDPPYEGLKRVSDTKTYYAPGFSLERHKELAEIAHNLRGKIILSYYPSPYIDEWYKDFYRIEIEVPKWGAGSGEGYVKPRATELLLFNYQPYPLFTLLDDKSKEEFYGYKVSFKAKLD